MEPNQRIGLEESVNLTDNSNDSNNDQSLNEQLIEISEKYNTLKTEYHKINEELEKTTQELEAAKEESKFYHMIHIYCTSYHLVGIYFVYMITW